MKCPIRAPPANSTSEARRTMRSAALMFGCLSTSRTMGAHTTRKGRSPLLSEWSRSAFLTASIAVHTSTAIFANSEGWNETPRFSQRRAPLMRGAMDSVPGSTVRRSRIAAPISIGQASRRRWR